jgi:hypothetical protein
MLLVTPRALGFCGFYVAKADTRLFNNASKVVTVRHDGKTALTMANDYKRDPQEFALAVPVPTFLERQQSHIGDRAVLEHLDAYSAPRLVEARYAVFLEYAWDLGRCDPCAANPLSAGELCQLGVFWLATPRIRLPGRHKAFRAFVRVVSRTTLPVLLQEGGHNGFHIRDTAGRH